MASYYNVPGQQSIFQTEVIVSHLLSSKENLSTTTATKLRQLKQPRVLWFCKNSWQLFGGLGPMHSRKTWNGFCVFPLKTSSFLLIHYTLYSWMKAAVPTVGRNPLVLLYFYQNLVSSLNDGNYPPYMEDTYHHSCFMPMAGITNLSGYLFSDEPRTQPTGSHYQSIDFGVPNGFHPLSLKEPMFVSNS